MFYTPLCYNGSVDVQADLRRKIHDFIIWSWSKQWEILIVVISKSCSWWSELEEFLKLRNLVINDWFMCFLGWFRELAGGWRAIQMTCTHLGDFCWKVQIQKIWGGEGWPSKEEFLYKFCGTLHVRRSDRNC